MMVARLPVNEQERLKTLNEFYLLDLLPDGDFDNFSRLISAICGGDVICGLIDIDRHWSKFNKNIPAALINEIPFGPGAKNDDIVLVSGDTTGEGFGKSLASHKLGGFARIPLIAADNKALGAICVLSENPIEFCNQTVAALQAVAQQIVRHLALLNKIGDLKQSQIEQKSAYADLEKFSFVASHDLRSPLNNIISLTQILKEEFGEQLNEEGRDYINFLNSAANQLADLVSGILEYSRSSQILVEQKELVNLGELIEEVRNLLHVPEHINIVFDYKDREVHLSRIALKQILLNLCDNAIKHSDKPSGQIEIRFDENQRFYVFTVSDNGPGIPKQDQRRIFDLFERVHHNHSRAIEGIGVGLSIVKRLVEKSGGEIRVESEPGAGTSFQFTILK
jgi:signal transduction histidine kinase